MSFTSSDFIGVRLERLVEFCRRVHTIKQTPDLISLVASEAEYVGFCRKITDPKEKFQKRFAAVCRANRIDPDAIQKRVRLVASVLGVHKQVDYYKILDVPADADAQAIKRAYRKKAQILHPDKAVGDDKDGVKFVELHDAYVHLSDPQVRELYDQMRIGADRWIEGNGSKQRSAISGGAGRFLSWIFLLIGSMVMVAYAFDLYKDGPLTFLWEKLTSDRMDGRHDAPIQMPGKSAVRANLAVPEDDDLEMAALRKHFPEPIPMSMEPSEKPAGTDDELMFFNPRRKQRYWASEASRHDRLDDAVAALADMYHHTPEWVQSHMGEENALQAIHQKLSAKQAIEKTLAESAKIDEMPQDKPTALGARASTYEKPVVVKLKKTVIMPTARTSVLEHIKNDSSDYAEKQRRVAEFLKEYTKAYERKDLDRFKSFFAKTALEQGNQFEKMLPTYRKTFRLVEALRYHIDIQSFDIDNISKKIIVEGAFTVSFRLPEKDWCSSSGSIRLELLDTQRGLLVCRLDYEMGDQ